MSIQCCCHEGHWTTKLCPKFYKLPKLAGGKIVRSPDTPRMSFFRELDPAGISAHFSLEVSLDAVSTLRCIAGTSAVAVGKAAALKVGRGVAHVREGRGLEVLVGYSVSKEDDSSLVLTVEVVLRELGVLFNIYIP